MSGQHTPGPWTYGTDPNAREDCPPVIEIFATDGRGLIAELNPYAPSVSSEGVPLPGCGGDHEANARLMAAAPTMLDELVNCHEVLVAYRLRLAALGCEPFFDLDARLTAVEAAIAGATGATSEDSPPHA